MSKVRIGNLLGWWMHIFEKKSETDIKPTWRLLMLVIVFFCIILTSQSYSREKKERQLGNQLREMHRAVLQLEGSVGDLRSAVDGFDYEDWKDVVPNVQNATENVEEQTASVKEEIKCFFRPDDWEY